MRQKRWLWKLLWNILRTVHEYVCENKGSVWYCRWMKVTLDITKPVVDAYS